MFAIPSRARDLHSLRTGELQIPRYARNDKRYELSHGEEIEHAAAELAGAETAHALVSLAL